MKSVIGNLPFMDLPGRYANLLGQTLRALFRSPPSRTVLLDQMHNVGNRSILFITVTIGFLGFMLVYEACINALKVIPELSGVGGLFISTFVSEFGPTITALMIAIRVGSGIAAELGSMKVTDQLDAMRLTNTDPVEYVLAPRFVATSIMTVVLSIYAVAVGTAAGMLVAATRFQINPKTFLTLRNVDWADFGTGLTKAVAYGIVIPIIAAESGFRTEGGSEGVGWATTRAVVNTSFAVIMLDFVIGSIFYLVT